MRVMTLMLTVYKGKSQVKGRRDLELTDDVSVSAGSLMARGLGMHS